METKIYNNKIQWLQALFIVWKFEIAKAKKKQKQDSVTCYMLGFFKLISQTSGKSIS